MITHYDERWIPCDPERLSQLEAMLRYQLPNQYRNWLLEFNGGFPLRSAFTIPGSPFSDNDLVTAMLGLVDNEEYSILSHIRTHLWMLRENFFPIAFAASSSYLGLQMQSKSEAIVMIDVCDEGDSDGFRQHFIISKNVDTFLKELW